MVNRYNQLHQSIYNMIERKNRERKYSQDKDQPSQKDIDERLAQVEEGVRLFNSGLEYSQEELRAKGFYVLQQYLIEKRRHDATIVSYNLGKNAFYEQKNIETFNDILRNNPDFLRGYYEAAGMNWFNQGRSIEDIPEEFQDNVCFLDGFKTAQSEQQNNNKHR